jgi:hypothetical protein
MYVEVGARLGTTPIPTKKALREAMKATPDKVYLTLVSDFDIAALRTRVVTAGRAYAFPSVTWQVVGPDPFTSRKWYASINCTGRVS